MIDAMGDTDVAARAGAPVDDGHGYFHARMYFATANVCFCQLKRGPFDHRKEGHFGHAARTLIIENKAI
jgi:hypothetical protein